MNQKMSKTFLLRIIYRNGTSLHNITSAVESVKGVRIQRLNFINKGKDFVGTIAVEAANLIDFDRVITLVRLDKSISKVEGFSEGTFCYG